MNRKKILAGIAAFIFTCAMVSGCQSAEDEPSVPVICRKIPFTNHTI